jgi:hypothetical protein
MKRQPNSTKTKPTVARYFQSLGSNHLERNLNVHMFTEDVHLAIMPIGGRSTKQNKFSITFNGSKDECERAQLLIECIARSDRHDHSKNVCNAVEEIGNRLSWEGCAVYEIINNEDDIPYLYGFTSKNLIRLFGWFLQIIPRGDWELWNKKWVLIPHTKIWRIEMPKDLGGRKGYLSIISKLKRFDGMGHKFWREAIEYGKQSTDFDFQKYILNSDIYRSKVTKTWGWNRRDWTQKRTTEFFCFYKMVNFRLAQAVLREHIVNELNILFSRVGIDCKLIVNGLPTASEIKEIRCNLLAGKLTFTTASDAISLS